MYISIADWWWPNDDFRNTVTHTVKLHLTGMYSGTKYSVTLYRIDRESATLLKIKGEQNIKPRLRDHLANELWHLHKVERKCT